jgi:hypothetical protein
LDSRRLDPREVDEVAVEQFLNAMQTFVAAPNLLLCGVFW